MTCLNSVSLVCFSCFSSGTGYLRSVFSVQSFYSLSEATVVVFFILFCLFLCCLKSSTTNQLQCALIILSAVLWFLSGVLNAHSGADLKGTLRAQSDSDPVSLFCLIGGRLALNPIYCSSLNFCTVAWTFFKEYPDVLLQSVMWAQSLNSKIPGAIWYELLGLKTDIFICFNNLKSIKQINAHEIDRISRRCPHSGEFLY